MSRFYKLTQKGLSGLIVADKLFDFLLQNDDNIRAALVDSFEKSVYNKESILKNRTDKPVDSSAH